MGSLGKIVYSFGNSRWLELREPPAATQLNLGLQEALVGIKCTDFYNKIGVMTLFYLKKKIKSSAFLFCPFVLINKIKNELHQPKYLEVIYLYTSKYINSI